MQIPVTKKINDGEITRAEEEFTFTMQVKEDSEAGYTSEEYDTAYTVAQVTIQGTGTANFAAMYFDHAGTYTYTITEEPFDYAGYTRDTASYDVVIRVEEDENDQLEVAGVSYIRTSGEEVTEEKKAVFNNIYTSVVGYDLNVKKRINKRDDIVTDQEFEFELTLEPERKRTCYTDPECTQIFTETTVKITGSGKTTFPTLYFNKEEAYSFVLTEKEINNPHYTRDPVIHGLYIYVSEEDGQLKVSKVLDNVKNSIWHQFSDNTPYFDNKYTVTASIPVTGTKILTGRDMAEGEFKFRLSDENNNWFTEGKNDASGNITFDEPITVTIEDMIDDHFVTEKDFHYTVTEISTDSENVTYDTAVKNITVHAVYDKSSDSINLTLSSDSDPVIFTNTYTATASVGLNGTKTLEGRTIREGEFTFKVTDENGTTTVLTGQNDENGNIIFADDLVYDLDDMSKENGGYEEEKIYIYKVKEEKGDDPSVTYDTTEKTIKVKVTYSKETGKLQAVLTEDSEPLVFTNTYHAKGSVTFRGLKELTGNRAKEIREGEFTFTVTDDETGEVAATGMTKEGGAVEFTEITYTEKEEGDHTYTITENQGQDPSVDYSDAKIRVAVHVTDNSDGTLEVEAVYPDSGITFTNGYHAQGKAEIEAEKIFEGSPLTEGQFSFELKDENGSVLQTKYNDGEGKVIFDGLEYTEENIGRDFFYTVSEVNNNITGVTYDENVYIVKIHVEDSEESDGTLDITQTILKDEEECEVISFTNCFAGSVKLVKVSTENRPLPGAEFKLYVRTAESDVYELYTANNEEGLYVTDASGNICVTSLFAGEYYFIETKAPDGYKLRKEEDGTDRKYSFIIGITDGNAGIEENAAVDAEVTAENDIDGTNNITVTKKATWIDPDTLGEYEIVWPKETYYVNLFIDEEGKIPYRTEEPQGLTIADGGSGTAVFENVSKGTYYVFETDENGNSIPMDSQIKDGDSIYACVVDGEGTNSIDLDVSTDAQEGKINLINRYYDLPDNPAIRAWLSISKEVLKGEDSMETEETFYAGIFTKDDNDEYYLFKNVELVNNDTVTTEVVLGGVNGNEPITYYVFETDSEGNMIDKDGFRYEVTGEGTVALDRDNNRGNITITNTLIQEYELKIRKVNEDFDGISGAGFRIVDGNGEIKEEWTSDKSAHPLELKPGTYRLSEIVAPDGYKPGSDVTITVDEDGSITVESEVDGDINFEEEDGELDYINYPETTPSVTPTATPTITPMATPTVTQKITPTITPSGRTTTTTGTTGGTSVTYTGRSVKTGDETQIAFYVLLLMAAVCGAGGVIINRRKKTGK